MEKTTSYIPKKIVKNNLKEEVKKEFLKYIKSMDLQQNNKLPREEELCIMFGVSRITLRDLLGDMAKDGILFRYHGKGTFVNPSFFEMKVTLDPIMHFTDMIKNSGYTPSTKLLYNKEHLASKDIAEMLNIKEGSPILICSKIFYADKKFCAYCEDYIPLSLIPSEKLSNMKNYKDSIFYFLYKEANRKIVWDKIVIEAVNMETMSYLSDEIKAQIYKPNKALLLLKGLNYDQNNELCFYAKEYVDTDIISFSQIRNRKIIFD